MIITNYLRTLTELYVLTYYYELPIMTPNEYMFNNYKEIVTKAVIGKGKKTFIDKFTFLKERVIEALSKLKLDDNERVFRALKSSLDDESVQVKINAIEALMESNHPKAFETIKTCLQDKDEEVRKNALIALYNLEGSDILDEVISLPVYKQSLKEEAKYMIEEYDE